MRICYLPSDMDAPGFYRCLSPGRQLAEHGDDVFMPKRTEKTIEEDAEGGGGTKKRYLTAFDLNLILPDSADLYVFQQWKERVVAEEGIHKIRSSGSATAMDVDDNYINLPSYNPAFAGTHPYREKGGRIIGREERRRRAKVLAKSVKGDKDRRRVTLTQARSAPNAQNRQHMLDSMRQVDLVTVSTPFLAEIYSPYNANIKVIRNCVDWDIWSDIQPQYEVERERVRIGWYGAFNYRRGDLQTISKPLSRFLRDHPQVDFVTNAEAAHGYLGVPQAQRVTLGEYDFYNHETGEYNVGHMTAHCDIGLVPLAMNDLNEGKSHLKGMEYNAAGIPFIASPTESYKDYWCSPGDNGWLAESENDWYELMSCLVSGDSLRREMGYQGRRKARLYSIQQNWKQWRDVYAELVGGEHHKTARKCISMGAVQKVSELAPLLKMVAQEQPRTIVEIGTARGGTFWGLAQTAPDDALLISMDIPAGSPMDVRDGKDVYAGRDRDRIKHMIKKGQTLKLIDMNSQLPQARGALLHALEGRQIDLLFIDGDHRYEGVKHDYETYSQFVRPGGMICFHDIVTHHDKRVGVSVLWSEIENGLELIGPETWGYTPWGGIGVVFKEG